MHVAVRFHAAFGLGRRFGVDRSVRGRPDSACGVRRRSPGALVLAVVLIAGMLVLRGGSAVASPAWSITPSANPTNANCFGVGSYLGCNDNCGTPVYTLTGRYA
jgi:hypothetical protein